jgi:hypothetical protein
MGNTDASENNVESPSTYGKEGYKEYRKKEKQSKTTDASSSNKEVNHVEGKELEEGQTFQY